MYKDTSPYSECFLTIQLDTVYSVEKPKIKKKRQIIAHLQASNEQMCVKKENMCFWNFLINFTGYKKC